MMAQLDECRDQQAIQQLGIAGSFPDVASQTIRVIVAVRLVRGGHPRPGAGARTTWLKWRGLITGDPGQRFDPIVRARRLWPSIQ